MAWSSNVPAVMDALVDVWKGAPSLAGVDIEDGPFLSQATKLEILCVGWTGGDGETSAEGDVVLEGLARTPDREQVIVRCAAAVLNGSGDIAAARSRAYELMSLAGDVIAQERTLGGAVGRAWMGTHNLTQTQDKSGATAIVAFEVNGDGYTRR